MRDFHPPSSSSSRIRNAESILLSPLDIPEGNLSMSLEAHLGHDLQRSLKLPHATTRHGASNPHATLSPHQQLHFMATTSTTTASTVTAVRDKPTLHVEVRLKNVAGAFVRTDLVSPQ